MYHALLANRYLTSRVIPLIAVASVALCTALVIIVISIMSGFLGMVRASGQVLVGDVIISYPIIGLPHYERLIAEIERLPEAEAATPAVNALGVLGMPFGAVKEVQVWGVEPASFSRVTNFGETLVWKDVPEHFTGILIAAMIAEHWSWLRDTLSPEQRREVRSLFWLSDEDMFTGPMPPLDERRARIGGLGHEKIMRLLQQLTNEQMRELNRRDPRALNAQRRKAGEERERPSVIAWEGTTLQRTTGEPGIVLGIHVSQANDRQRDGTYDVIGRWWMPTWPVTLTLFPLTREGQTIEPRSRIFPVLNEAQSGLSKIDQHLAIIPLPVAQEMLRLNASMRVDPNDLDENFMPRVVGVNPARVHVILIKGRAGVDPAALRDRVKGVYAAVRDQLLIENDPDPLPPTDFTPIRTWEEQQVDFIGPVEKERNLMRILFSIVYIVCAGLVLVIFWAIVHEKTRDIGILRSVGASRLGIVWIFVRYGLFVGIVGAIAGLGLAWLVVSNINHIHDQLGETFPLWVRILVYAATGVTLLAMILRLRRETLLPVVLLGMSAMMLLSLSAWMHLHQGFLMWDPKVYYFTKIPNEVDFLNAGITMLGAVVFSAVGALIPAARAGDIDPVHALRYE